jgi:mRNA-degrading endonuclease RelE of RelBE toxin-antitoxin system
VSYKLIIERKAEKDAAKIPHHLRVSIDKAILALAQNPRPRGSKKLTDEILDSNQRLTAPRHAACPSRVDRSRPVGRSGRTK